MALDKETFNQLLASIEKFVANELIPMEKKVADDDAVPPAIIEQMKEMGLFGLSIPEEYGGIGLSAEEEVHVIQKLGYASPAFRSVIGTNVGIGSQGILLDGTEKQTHLFHLLNNCRRNRIIIRYLLLHWDKLCPLYPSDAAD